MKDFLKIINQNQFFYLLNLFLMLAVTVFLCYFGRAEGFIWLNQIHSSILTTFFEAITFLGDGWFSIVFALGILILLKKNKELAFTILLAYISSGIFSQIIKNLIDSPRPKVYFEVHQLHYYVDTFATSRVGYRSFPSGHTASIFALATVFSIYWKKITICIFAFIISFFVGYSRIYLGHHFLIDVLFGAIIGIFFGSLSIIWVRKMIQSPLIKNRISNNINFFSKRR
jgi:membrane-associated phospholipid phosphatase